jgi:nucleoside-diphosphate-sugar epimerase
MISLDHEHKLVITGAGGWLGTELLELLLATYGTEKIINNVVCLGSRARTLQLSDGTKLQIRELTESVETDHVAGFVHLAFLTRDKVSVFGTEDYSFRNLAITSRAIRLIEQIRPNWIATVSSGAVFSEPSGPLENNVLANPYGFTKRVEETMLSQVAHDMGANLSVGRLWGAMGSYMPVNRAYAVSDFIVQAHSSNSISIRADHEVWRKYCDAQEFMNVLVTSAETYTRTTYDSGGELIEIGELAKKIAGLSNSGVAVDRPGTVGIPDRYFPDGKKYDHLCESLGIPQTKLNDVLRSTYKSHLAQFSS